jgi:hypothetical protein
LETIAYRTGGITAEEAAKTGLVFIEPAPGKANRAGARCLAVICLVIVLRLTYEAIRQDGWRSIPALLVMWGFAAVVMCFVLLSCRTRDELWLSRNQIYCARRWWRGPLRPVMSAQTVKQVDIVALRPRNLDIDVVEIVGAEGVIHFGPGMDEVEMARVVQQIRDWVEQERGWELPPVFEESEVLERLKDEKSFGRGNQTWEGVDLARQRTLTRAWLQRKYSRRGRPIFNTAIFQEVGGQADFALPQGVREAISVVALIMFFAVSFSGIALTIRWVIAGLVKENWVTLLLCVPFVVTSVVLGWIGWIMVQEYSAKLSSRQ